MWTLATFIYTALGGVLGFIANHMSSESTQEWSLELEKPLTLFIAAILGCFGSGYGIYMLKQYGEHVRRGWNRANYIRAQIKSFDEIWNNDDPKIIKGDKNRGKGMPNIIKQGLVPMIVFLFIFLALGVLILIQFKN